MRKIYSSVLSLSMMSATTGTLATAFDDIGFTILKNELGASLSNGTGVKVAQVEASISGAWIPNSTDAQFFAKTLTEVSIGSAGVSAHANEVAKFFYGNTISTAPGITNVELFEVNDWLFSGFLNAFGAAPNISATRLANHSWNADAEATAAGLNVDILRRADYVVEVDEYIQVAAMNKLPATSHLLSDSFNAIVVSVSKGSGEGTTTLDAIYTGGRTRPDIVAPENTLSGAAPRVAAAAALLIDHGHSNTPLSTDPLAVSKANRNGDTIYNAERSETIKAVLMAGADRYTLGNTNPAAPNNVDVIDYRAYATKQTNNGLDTRFGAGQINIYNSYHILDTGEQNSAEDLPAGAGAIGNVGFDYDPAFGGLNLSNAAATYNFTTGANAGQKLKASLVWNLQVAASNVLYDLDLQLIDVTAGGTVVASSTSTIDNTENIWFDLASNNEYQLKVIRGAGQADFEWDYALAWQILTLPIVTAGQVFSIDENSAPATVIGTVTATVPTGTITKYAIFSGNTGNVFAINNSGILTVAGAIDYETTASYSLGIAATDGLNVSNAEMVLINVNNINDVAPVVAASQTLSIDENSPVDASVGSVVADDVESGIVGFSIVGGSTVFAIDSSGLITVIGALDYEATPSYTLSITATDDINASGAVDVVININNLDEVAPTVTAAQSFNINENSANGTSVGTVIATDAADAGGIVSGFNVVSGNTGNAFAIASNGAISVVGVVDYETTTSYILGVTATDDSGNTSGAVNVVIYVNDINDAPVVTASQTLSIDENSSVGASVGTVAAGDVDSAITGFVIEGGSAVFAIDNSGLITVAGIGALDYEATPSYTLSITATDSINTSGAVVVVININNLDEAAPTVAAAQSFSIDENSANGTLVGAVVATDAADAGGVVTGFNIVSGNTGNVFAIAANGVITVVGTLDYETTPSYTLSITATDGVNTSAPVNVVITVNDVVESSASAGTSSGGGGLSLMWLLLPLLITAGRRRVS